MANIYLRVPTYVAQFYRGLDAEHLLAEHDAYEFMEFQHEYWLMKNYLHLIPENQQTNNYCYSQRAWNNILAGKDPAGTKSILKRERTVWPTMTEVCTMIGEKKIQRMDGYDYLCIKIPTEVMMGDALRKTNGSYSLEVRESLILQRILRNEFIHYFLDWVIQDRRYCNKVGLYRPIGSTIERFYERYYIQIGRDVKERNSMYRMSRRWIIEAKILPNDRIDFADSDITTLTESEEQRLEQEYTPDSLLNEYKTERKKKLKGSV